MVCPLDHPATDTTPFGQAVKKKAEEGGGWLTWVLSTNDITLIEKRLGRNSVSGLRKKPDGSELNWKQIGVLATLEDSQLPFFVEWISDNHPSADGTPVAKIDKIELLGEEKFISNWIDQSVSSVFGEVEMVWETPVKKENRNGILSIDFNVQNKIINIE